MLPHLFERFQPGANVVGQPSIGLGLAIAKALAEAQGGLIKVQSTTEHGSTFAVVLLRAS